VPEAEQPGREAPLEDEHEQAIGCADREQIENDRRAGDDDRAKRDRQQHERQSEHEGEDVRRRTGDRVEVLGVLPGRPEQVGRGAGACEGGSHDVLAQVADRGNRAARVRIAADGRHEQNHLP
jgi:hypothetical protein